ncbi:fumarylacetoacetate hydrolase family protein [Paenibacillus qinlingensis]|uniref:2-keto-4-pentenoate hydratase/2-oxohepta-3-ene-1,7-dioic acid hydratase in catechol pathway n=1 Tax=Paenibacillus qinlingensis TaxID=1837343 RepID=A0ABU1P0D3_9BACL|nr:fumarylacetoacetate hydrolase family protein [Paenibacillus qinlingensis]MDR6553203.1 2-keto-4-pentenoate hydratase/2-oxohepta-3-ene-1,7-dioic acid hydratase in catechol pathway [Paenibacillus qinlingensis]
MKLVQFYTKQDPNKLQVGIVKEESTVQVLSAVCTARDVIRGLAESGKRAADYLAACAEGGALYPLEDVKLASPLTDPEKIICIGLNYHDHVIESNMQVPKVPVLFPKYNNCLIGHEDFVTIPREVSQCDYEVELAVVIGRTTKRVTKEDAMDYVFGYTVLNDVSARDIQLNEPQWTRGKAIDGFAPTGPWIVTSDEIATPGSLNISLTLNGQVMQNSNTKELIFDIPHLVSFLSNTITLQPGDIISTGTPPGVGMGRKPQVWLKPGDVVEATIEGIGTLRNTFVAER